MSLRHQDVVVQSVQRYCDALDSVRQSAPSLELRAAIEAIITASHACLSHGASVDLSEVRLSPALVMAVSAAERAKLVNQFSLGLGSPAAELIVVGTEHAYDLEHDVANFCLESCGCAITWATGSRPDVVEKLSGRKGWVSAYARPFHQHPNDFYRVDRQRGRHTWKGLATLLSDSPTGPSTSLDALGAHTYQFELSAYPARSMGKGALPSSERLDFLGEVIDALVTARVLLFHGKRRAEQFRRIREPLVRRFLGLASSAPLLWGSEGTIEVARANGRTVLVSRHLSGNVSNAQLETLRLLVARAVGWIS